MSTELDEASEWFGGAEQARAVAGRLTTPEQGTRS